MNASLSPYQLLKACSPAPAPQPAAGPLSPSEPPEPAQVFVPSAGPTLPEAAPAQRKTHYIAGIRSRHIAATARARQFSSFHSPQS